VRDASSDNDHRPPPGNGSSRAHGEPPQPAANLAELAQLLAASIAQNQANRGQAGGVPTNADLTSLAKLVSAAAGQRTLAPVFKDGLSALSYTQPRGASQPAAAPSLELGHDDEPMPIPSTWRQPASHDEDPWLRQQMGAAILGLVAGLLIVVPTVLWLSGWFDPNKSNPTPTGRTAAVAPETRASADAAEIKAVKVQVRPKEKPADSSSPYTTGSVEPTPTAQAAPKPADPAPTATTARLIEPRARQEELLAYAAQRIEGGDVAGARDLLAGADDGAQGSVAFALAETYDPNMLAAWGARGVGADVAKARALYRKAMSLGAPRAQARLDALK
jgi:hypothetical protein